MLNHIIVLVACVVVGLLYHFTLYLPAKRELMKQGHKVPNIDSFEIVLGIVFIILALVFVLPDLLDLKQGVSI